MSTPPVRMLIVLLSLTMWSGCGRTTNQNDAIRDAINAHVAAKGTLDMSAFQTEVQKVTIQGDQAQAEVVFRVKDGPGMMQLGYTLKNTNGNWAVMESNPVGSNFEHPSLDGTGATPGAPQSGGVPDIFDAIRQRTRTPSPGPPVTGTNQPK